MIEAFPAYDNAQHEWGIGVTPPSSGTVTNRNLQGTDLRWIISLNPLPIQPGQYDFTEISARVGNTQSANVANARVAIYSLQSTTFHLEAFASIPVGSLPGSGAGNFTYAIPDGELSLCAKEGVNYFWALALQGKNGRSSNNPSIAHQNSGIGPVQSYVYNTSTNGPTDPKLPVELDSTSADFSPSSGGYHILGTLAGKTTTRKVFSAGTEGAPVFDASDADLNPSRMIIPYRTDGPVWIVLRSAAVAAGKTMVCQMSYGADNATEADLDVLVVNMSSHNIGYNNDGGIKNVPVNSSEAGETIDYGIVVRQDGDDTTSNPFWVNRSSGQGPGGSANDIMTRSHRTWWEKNVNSQTDEESRVRGKDGYVAVGSPGNPEYLFLTSTDDSAATKIDTIEVCDRLNVLFGDSDVGLSAGEVGGTAVPGRLGKFFPDALASPLTWWLAGIPNCAFLVDVRTNTDPDEFITGGYQRFCNDTAGDGDICDTRAVLLMFHMGGNDLKSGVDEDNRNDKTAALMTKLSLMISQVLQNENDLDNRMFLFAMPILIAVDEGGGGTFDSIQRKVFDQWSQSLLGLACTWRLPFCNPYYLAITNDDYMDDANDMPQHYTDVGAEAVCAEAAVAY